MAKGTTEFTVEELEKMIQDYLDYWSDPLGKGDHDIAAANVLGRSALAIAQQLVDVLKADTGKKNGPITQTKVSLR